MKQRRWAILCLVSALSGAMLLSGCSSEKPQTKPEETQGGAQTGQLDPALAGDGGSDSAGVESNETGDAIQAIQQSHALSSTAKEQDGRTVVTNENSIYVVVNKERFLPDGYIPPDLVEPQVKFSFDGPHEKRQLRQDAATALEQLFQQAESEGIELNAVSGYRSYKRQTSVYNNHVNTKGEEYANRVSAKPGTSEHQTGLTMDVSSPSANNELEQSFGDTTEGQWLAEHAHEFGFIIRYTKDGEAITGYMYEPWHIRYVGKEAAQAIFEQGTTLEQFLQ
ncbi:M15 family metallopeptidase [Paenibacillus arenosi]|uniref:D-alanyl-D-alanine carboxypeptidase family protein n=1 Tax=Paenibacillus arenosi TaxID=2774142 RepID=A0ABR9B1Q6_9BACL|nr:M15 family metallopeptidase [Paenibacillus arenosi]MBD8499913.1 D-alanyl-D-alanine carboxypeptidase family protein [Paenibacillus arenosi]